MIRNLFLILVLSILNYAINANACSYYEGCGHYNGLTCHTKGNIGTFANCKQNVHLHNHQEDSDCECECVVNYHGTTASLGLQHIRCGSNPKDPSSIQAF